MPFQGTPNSGGVNPIALALQIRQMRNREKQDAQTARLANIKALSDAKIAQAQEQRAVEAHRLAMASSSFDLINKRDNQEAQVGELAVTANDENVSDQLRQQSASQFIESLEGGIENRLLGGESIESAAKSVGFNAGRPTRELQSALATEGRADARAVEAARVQDQRLRERARQSAEDAATLPNRRILDREKRIRSLINQQKTAKRPKDRARIQQDLTALQNAREADLTVNQPGEVFKQRKEVVDRIGRYTSKLDSIKVLEGIFGNEELLGVGANLQQLVKNIQSHGVNLSEIMAPDLRDAMERGTREEREWLEDVFENGINPETGFLIEESRLEEARVKWIILNTLSDKGRQNKVTIKEIGDIINFTGLSVSSAIAKDRLRGASNVLKRRAKRERDQIKFLMPSLEFGEDGEIVGVTSGLNIGLTAPTPATGALRADPAGTPEPAPEQGQTGNAIDDLPTGFTIEEGIRAAKEEAEKLRNAR